MVFKSLNANPTGLVLQTPTGGGFHGTSAKQSGLLGSSAPEHSAATAGGVKQSTLGLGYTSTRTEISAAQVGENTYMRLAAHIFVYISYLGLRYLRTFKSWGYPGEYLLDILNTGLSGVLGIERYLQIISRALRAPYGQLPFRRSAALGLRPAHKF